MKLAEALTAMDSGAKIRRATWFAQHYISLETGMSNVAFNNLTYHDLIAANWEVIEEPHDWDWAKAQMWTRRKVRRRVWSGQDSIARTIGVCALNVEDVNATDWECLPLPELQPEAEPRDWDWASEQIRAGQPVTRRVWRHLAEKEGARLLIIRSSNEVMNVRDTWATDWELVNDQ